MASVVVVVLCVAVAGVVLDVCHGEELPAQCLAEANEAKLDEEVDSYKKLYLSRCGLYSPSPVDYHEQVTWRPIPPPFPAHEYTSNLRLHLGPQTEPIRDHLLSALDRGNFTIIFHGMQQAGKTSLISKLIGEDILESAPRYSRGQTQKTLIYRVQIDDKYINIVDTPGFGEISTNDQLLYEIDNVIRFVKDNESVAPLRRVYYVLEPDTNYSPLQRSCIQRSLDLIQLAYGLNIKTDVQLIISKWDQLQKTELQSGYESYRQEIAERYGLRNGTSVLLVSSMGCFRQLLIDLIAAGDNVLPVPGGLENGPGGLRDVWTKIRTDMMQHNYHLRIRDLWQCNKLEALQNGINTLDKEFKKYKSNGYGKQFQSAVRRLKEKSPQALLKPLLT